MLCLIFVKSKFEILHILVNMVIYKSKYLKKCKFSITKAKSEWLVHIEDGHLG